MNIDRRDELKAVFEKYRTNPDFLLCESFDHIDTPGQLSGDTVLHIAVRSGVEADIQRLLDLGASPNFPGDIGMTALHYAVRLAGGRLIRILRKAGADPALTNAFNQTPLDLVRLRAEPGDDMSDVVRALTCPLDQL